MSDTASTLTIVPAGAGSGKPHYIQRSSGDRNLILPEVRSCARKLNEDEQQMLNSRTLASEEPTI